MSASKNTEPTTLTVHGSPKRVMRALTATAATGWIIALAVVLLSVRLARFIDRYAVDLLFSDQWDFLQGVFDGRSAWALFRWQHGPARQGLGNLITAVLYESTGWNTRADGALEAMTMLLAGLAGLWLVRRACGPLRPWDAIVPMLFLTTANVETYIVTPNLSNGPLPALLAILLAVSFTISSHPLRCASVVVLNYLAVNTGFGLLLGAVTPVMLLVFAWSPGLTARDRRLYLGGFTITIATLVAFFYGYRNLPAVDCFQFPSARPWEYVPFAGFVLMRPIAPYAGLSAPRLALSTGVALGWLGTSAYATWRLARRSHDRTLWAVVCTLVSFSLLFAFGSAIGRTCLGLSAANATRYIPYVLPGMLGFYLIARCAARPSARAVLLSLYLVTFVSKEWRARSPVAEAETFSDLKRRWRDCYLTRHDVDACSNAGMSIHPAPLATHLQRKLDWLEEHRYNLFREQPKAPSRP